jgi:hypothetical protein
MAVRSSRSMESILLSARRIAANSAASSEAIAALNAVAPFGQLVRSRGGSGRGVHGGRLPCARGRRRELVEVVLAGRIQTDPRQQLRHEADPTMVKLRSDCALRRGWSTARVLTTPQRASHRTAGICGRTIVPTSYTQRVTDVGPTTLAQ